MALNPEVGPELSPNFQDTTIWDKTNANRRIGLNHCEAVSKELRIDILRLPTQNSEEPFYSSFFSENLRKVRMKADRCRFSMRKIPRRWMRSK